MTNTPKKPAGATFKYTRDAVSVSITKTSGAKATATTDAAKSGNSVFQEITNTEKQYRLLAEAIDLEAPARISGYGADGEIGGNIFLHDRERGRLRFQINGRREELAQFRVVAKNLTEFAFSLSLRQSRVFFSCKDFRWTGDASGEVGVPEKVFVVQRRNAFRLPLTNSGRFATLTSATGLNLYSEIFDLSVSGFALLCDEAQVQDLRKQQSNPVRAYFQIDEASITVDAIDFRHATLFRTLGATKIYKVGFAFKSLGPDMRVVIRRFVDRKTLEYFQRYSIGE